MANDPVNVRVPALPIPLGSFLKRTGLFETGGSAKVWIQEGRVAVNGVVETRRRHSLQEGDRVQFEGQTFVVGSSD